MYNFEMNQTTLTLFDRGKEFHIKTAAEMLSLGT